MSVLNFEYSISKSEMAQKHTFRRIYCICNPKRMFSILNKFKFYTWRQKNLEFRNRTKIHLLKFKDLSSTLKFIFAYNLLENVKLEESTAAKALYRKQSSKE